MIGESVVIKYQYICFCVAIEMKMLMTKMILFLKSLFVSELQEWMRTMKLKRNCGFSWHYGHTNSFIYQQEYFYYYQ